MDADHSGFQAARAARGIAECASAVKLAAAVVAPLVCLLGVLGGIGSFTTVRHLAVPWFGQSAWIIPVGVDAGILILLAWDLLAEYLGLSWPVLRWTAWAFITATTYLNIAAAHGNPTASIMHAAMPVLFVTVVEGIRHLIRQWTGLITGARIERIPLSRWLLAPRSTALLARHMVLWHVTSYREGLTLEYERLVAVFRLQEKHGRWLWRWRAPLSERLGLRLGPAAVAVSARSAAAEIFTNQTGRTGRRPGPHLTALPQTLNDRDAKLVEAAVAIVREADERGIWLSQTALAQRLRGRGLSIPNQRLRWLAAAARAEARATSGPGDDPCRQNRTG